MERDHLAIGWMHGLDLSGTVQELVADCCECGNEPLSSVKGREFLD